MFRGTVFACLLACPSASRVGAEVEDSSRLAEKAGYLGQELLDKHWLEGLYVSIVASGPGGAYLSSDGESWRELNLWRENETGAADNLHAYWMGRYDGFVPAD